jgi:hypothetical protein
MPNVATQGPAKDANLRAVFIDRITIHTPDGKPIGKTGSNRLVYLVAPVKEPGGTNVQLVIGGLTEDPADAPGPFGNYCRRPLTPCSGPTASNGTGAIVDSQDWVFAAASGERLEMHIRFERGVGNKGNAADVKFYSARNPGVYQISRQEQVLDILRNVTTTPPDRVKEFSFKAGGGSYAKLFDGTERVLSWDNILWLNRAVQQPMRYHQYGSGLRCRGRDRGRSCCDTTHQLIRSYTAARNDVYGAAQRRRGTPDEDDPDVTSHAGRDATS